MLLSFLLLVLSAQSVFFFEAQLTLRLYSVSYCKVVRAQVLRNSVKCCFYNNNECFGTSVEVSQSDFVFGLQYVVIRLIKRLETSWQEEFLFVSSKPRRHLEYSSRYLLRCYNQIKVGLKAMGKKEIPTNNWFEKCSSCTFIGKSCLQYVIISKRIQGSILMFYLIKNRCRKDCRKNAYRYDVSL